MTKPNNVSSQLPYLALLIPNLLAIAAPSQALLPMESHSYMRWEENCVSLHNFTYTEIGQNKTQYASIILY